MISIPFGRLKEIIGEEKYREIAENFAGFSIYVPKKVIAYAEQEEMYLQMINAKYTHQQALETMSLKLGISRRTLSDRIRKMKSRKEDEDEYYK